MPTVGFGRINADATLEEVVERIGKLEKTLEYLFGGLDTKNIREVGGWLVNPTEIISKDGDVGMSTEDTGADDIRFFAGAPGGVKEQAPWRVYKSGKGVATGWTLETASGYPKIILDPDSNLLKVMASATKFIQFVPLDGGSGVPAIYFRDTVTSDSGLLQLLSAGFQILTTGNDIFISASGGDVNIFGSNIRLSGDIEIDSGDSGTFTTADGKTVKVENGIITDIS